MAIVAIALIGSPVEIERKPKPVPVMGPSTKRNGSGPGSETDALDDQRYRAQDFVRWLELELAPPAKPKQDCGPVYSVVGAGTRALAG